MSTLTELGDYLEAQGVASQALDLFLGEMPDTPDTLVALFMYPGGPPEYVQESLYPNAETVQLQVVTRSTHYDLADQLAATAWRALASITNLEISGTKYRSVRPNSSPGLMGRDSNNRPKVFFNATVEKEVSLV